MGEVRPVGVAHDEALTRKWATSVAKVLYELTIDGVVGDLLAPQLDGFDVISSGGGRTVLRGWVVDQSALHGVLDRIAALGLDLRRVAPVGGTEETTP